ncbi:MAG TPA: hypothetical protein VNK48_07455 [Xanthobacteraceae bacterium]|nr:hypothetical protein [Xanthobacteraceae bacterium]
MAETLSHLLLRRSEAGKPALLWGREARPFHGPAFDRLIAAGVLVALPPAREWQVCEDCDCGRDWRAIERIDGRLVAICPLDHKSDLALEEEDLESYEIKEDALVREIAAASGFAEEPSEVIAGLWHLGRGTSGRQVFLVLSRLGALEPGLIAAIRLVDATSQSTLIAPALPAAERVCFAEAGIHLVNSEECVGDSGQSCFVIDPAKLEPARTFAPRLSIVRSSQRVVLDGVERHVPQQPFGLLVLLAEAAIRDASFVPTHKIESANSGRTPSDLVRELKDCLAAGVVDPERVRRLIKNRRSPSGYALALERHEIELR